MRSSRGNAAMIVITIFTSALLMFGVPLIIITSEQDDAATLAAQKAVTEFVEKVANTGIMTQEDYDNLTLNTSTVRAYKLTMQVQKLDENPTKKTASGTTTAGVYYTLYDTQLDLPLKLNEGDTITVTAVPMDESVFEQLTNAIYRVTGNDSTKNIVQDSAMVTTTAN